VFECVVAEKGALRDCEWRGECERENVLTASEKGWCWGSGGDVSNCRSHRKPRYRRRWQSRADTGRTTGLRAGAMRAFLMTALVLVMRGRCAGHTAVNWTGVRLRPRYREDKRDRQQRSNHGW